MTKPHEEEWEQDEDSPVWLNYRAGNDSGTVANFDRHADPETMQLSEVDSARARLASKAPKMARALLQLLPDGEIGPNPPAHTRECIRWRTRHGVIDQCLPGCMETIEVLREAGVLE